VPKARRALKALKALRVIRVRPAAKDRRDSLGPLALMARAEPLALTERADLRGPPARLEPPASAPALPARPGPLGPREQPVQPEPQAHKGGRGPAAVKVRLGPQELTVPPVPPAAKV